MDDSCIEKIVSFLTWHTGISFRTKRSRLRSKLSVLMERLRIDSCEDLYLFLRNKDEIYDHILKELMVSQSYFYRETSDYWAIVEKAKSEPLKILSIPCANGEEPYTLAIELMDKGIEDFEIIALDINPSAIKKAKIGIYDQKDVALVPTRILQDYFICDGYKYIVKDDIKRKISFHIFNLFEDDFDPYVPINIVLCRNLFIYLDEFFIQMALDIFCEILKQNGLLMVSFSDYFKSHPCFDRMSQSSNTIYIKRR